MEANVHMTPVHIMWHLVLTNASSTIVEIIEINLYTVAAQQLIGQTESVDCDLDFCLMFSRCLIVNLSDVFQIIS